jgi:ribosomal protein S18 acetylase RimI-like enzyme
MINVVEITGNEDLSLFAAVIREAFQTVATDLGLTRENNPTNPAFIDTERLSRLRNGRVRFYAPYYHGEPVGFIVIEQSPDDDTTFFIEKLAILPGFRGRGYGKHLMDFAASKVSDLGGKKVSVALIDENRRLKDWYKEQGYVVTKLKEFGHLPFTVCFMAKELT